MKNRTSSTIQTALFLAFIGVFFLLFLILPDTGFSEQENRMMQQFPELTLKTLAEKKFITKFETYTTDQFPFRDAWTTVKAASELGVGKKENKDVFLCAGDRLIEAYAQPEAGQLEKNINAVISFVDVLKSQPETADVPVYFCLVPGIAGVRPELLPKGAPNASQKAVIDDCYPRVPGAIPVDMYSALKAHSDEYIYYRTDHHWTSLGAFYGYEAIMGAMGQDASPLSAFSRRVVTDGFYGTVYSKSGFSWVKPDEIEIFAEQAADTHVFNYTYTGTAFVEEETALYNYTFLEKKDKYSMFLGGISPLIKVTGGNTDAPSLLILRDSYTDSLIPFIQGEFSEIYIMDLRYCATILSNTTVAAYVAQNNIDRVLICYSVNNFGTDPNVYLIDN